VNQTKSNQWNVRSRAKEAGIGQVPLEEQSLTPPAFALDNHHLPFKLAGLF